MKRMLIFSIFPAVLAFPIYASAQTDTSAKQQNEMNCSMMDTKDMQKNMTSMMSEMGAMIKETGNPAVKEQMQKMQDQMAAMMGMMQKAGGGMSGGGMMGGGMMGGGMMQGGKDAGGMQPPVAPTPDDHKSHHPTE